MSISSAITSASGASRNSTYGILDVNATVTADGTIDGETVIIRSNDGALRAASSAGLIINESQVRILENAIGGSDPLTYHSNTRNVDLENSSIINEDLASGSTTRQNIRVRHLKRCVIADRDERQRLFVYTKTGAILDKTLFRGIAVWEIDGVPAQVSDVVVDNVGAGFLNWGQARLDFVGFDVANMSNTAAHGWIGSGNSGNNSVYNWNKGANFDNTKIVFGSSNPHYYEGYTICWRFIDSNGNAEGVRLSYWDDRETENTQALRAIFDTNSDGVPAGIRYTRTDTYITSLSVPETMDALYAVTGRSHINTSGAHPPGGITGAGTTIRTYDMIDVTPRYEVRSFKHFPLPAIAGQDFSIAAPIGKIHGNFTVDERVDVELDVDPAITEDKADVDAYTSITTSSQLYHAMVAHWVNFPEVTVPRPTWNNGVVTGNQPIARRPIPSAAVIIDQVVFETNSTWSADMIAEYFVAGRMVTINGTTKRVYTAARTGNRFTVGIDTGITWGTGNLVIPLNLSGSTYTFSSHTAQIASVDTALEWAVQEDVSIPANTIYRYAPAIEWDGTQWWFKVGAAHGNVAGASFTGNINAGTAAVTLNDLPVTGVVADSTGTTSQVTVTCADSNATVALYTAVGTQKAKSTGSYISTPLLLTESTAGVKAVAARPGYKAQVQTIDASSGGVITVAFPALEKDKMPDGTDMFPTQDLDSLCTVAYMVSDITSVGLRIDIGDGTIQARDAYRAAAEGAITNDGLKYLAFGGVSPTYFVDFASSTLVMNQSNNKLRALATGQVNTEMQATVFHPDNQSIDGSNGVVARRGGIRPEDLATSIAFNLDIDPNRQELQSIGGMIVACRDYSKAAALQTQSEPSG